MGGRRCLAVGGKVSVYGANELPMASWLPGMMAYGTLAFSKVDIARSATGHSAATSAWSTTSPRCWVMEMSSSSYLSTIHWVWASKGFGVYGNCSEN